ncbi:MAG: hypothetical protein Kow0075_08700 [Salibacteraceae bacterium]
MKKYILACALWCGFAIALNAQVKIVDCTHKDDTWYVKVFEGGELAGGNTFSPKINPGADQELAMLKYLSTLFKEEIDRGFVVQTASVAPGKYHYVLVSVK